MSQLKFWGYEQFLPKSSTPDHVDPPIEPSKLFVVQRIKPIKGTPYWERDLLRQLKLDGRMGDMIVVKNIPENNARLWKIKHLLKVTPITYPHGEPSLNDVNHTFLKENGECIVTKEIKVDEKRLDDANKFLEDPARMDGDTLRKNSRLKWLNPW